MREREMEALFKSVATGSMFNYQKALKIDSARAFNALPYHYKASYQCLLDLYKNHPNISECIPQEMYGTKMFAVWCTMLSASCYLKMTKDSFHDPLSKSIAENNANCQILGALAVHRFSDRLMEYIDPKTIEKVEELARNANRDTKDYCKAVYEFFSRFKGSCPVFRDEEQQLQDCQLSVLADDTYKPTCNLIPLMSHFEGLTLREELKQAFSACQ